jgi:hypothetical protein
MTTPKWDRKSDEMWWWVATLKKILWKRFMDRESLESLRLLRLWIKECDPARDIPTDARAKELRTKVMQAIENLEIENKPQRAVPVVAKSFKA